MRVDTIFRRGNIHTFDPAHPRASAVAVLAGRIVAVGDDDLVNDLQADRVVDLGGRTVTPGFNDAHNHMLFYGGTLTSMNLASPPMRSVADICAAVRERASQLPEGKIGRAHV